MLNQFMTSFFLSLAFLAPVAILAEVANGQSVITPDMVVDCSKVVCTTDGAELPPPTECVQELKELGYCLGEPYILEDI